MIVCVAGNPSIDKLFEVSEIVVGEIHRPDRMIALPGGKGIHVAQVATVLGAEAIVTGLLAGHTGRWVAQELAAEGVTGEWVWGAGETRSSLSVADSATGRLTEFYEDGTGGFRRGMARGPLDRRLAAAGRGLDRAGGIAARGRDRLRTADRVRACARRPVRGRFPRPCAGRGDRRWGRPGEDQHPGGGGAARRRVRRSRGRDPGGPRDP